MRRRSFLAATVTGAAVATSGCLEGEVVLDVNESTTVRAHRGWVQEIDDVEGAAEVSYTVRSSDVRFEVFYFTDPEEFQAYQEFTLGGNEDLEERPEGHTPLRAVAVNNEERGAFEAAVPGDGGRYSLDIEDTHYFVVDHSNYGEVDVASTADDLSVVIRLEVVKDRLW